LAIHSKLLEIFAKRRDAASFQSTAQQAFKLTGLDSPDWARICEMGLGIDPENSLYQPGAASASGFSNLSSTTGTDPASAFGATIAQSTNAELSAPANGLDLDLDLDFSDDDEHASAISDVTGGTVDDQTVKMEAGPVTSPVPLDFDISGPGELDATPALPEIDLSMDGVSLTGSGDLRPNFDSTSTMPIVPAVPVADAKDNSGMLEFDLGSLSLDLDPPPTATEEATEAPSTSGEDPLETKLALAEEFVSIGDEDGARALIEEVIAEATGDMRTKAQTALANLS
jgi:pilus assembly protein FimV